MTTPPTSYVLLTSARNEGSYIRRTLQSVRAQTLRPLRWVIVDDGSTDDTAAVVEEFLPSTPWLELHRRAGEAGRHFGSKARAINWAYEEISKLEFRFVGILDADLSFDPDYFAGVIGAFGNNPRLGLTGGAVYDHERGRVTRHLTRTDWSVSGAVQAFRRECFENMGGYPVLPHGGIDAVAEVMVRRQGYEVRTLPELAVQHYRPTGAHRGSSFAIAFRNGYKEYAYGSHPLFEIVKSCARLCEFPPVLGSLLRCCGYTWAFLRREPRPLPADVIRYLRREQLARLGLARRPAPAPPKGTVPA